MGHKRRSRSHSRSSSSERESKRRRRDSYKKEDRKEKDKHKKSEKEQNAEPKEVEKKQVPIKAQVTESGGEISCSIEETNRIRIALGLKPLQIDSEEDKKNKEEEEKNKEEESRKQQEKERRGEEIAKRIEKSKKQRELNDSKQVKSLGQILQSKGPHLSASEWVNKLRVSKLSKQIEEQEKEEEKVINEYDSNELKGLLIQHDLSKYDGDEISLTLKDSNVLDDLEENENGNAPVLINMDLMEEEKAKERNEIREKSHLPVYSGMEEEEFDPNYKPGENNFKKILPQYDEEERLKKKRQPKLMIGSNGEVAAPLKQDNNNNNNNQIKTESLQMENKSMNDYYTKEEIKFKTVKKKTSSKKKKANTRKKIELEDLLKEEEMESNNNKDNNSSEDLGSRNDNDNKSKALTEEEIEREKQRERELNYKKALEKSQLKSNKLTSSLIADDSDDENDLYSAINAARKNILSKRNNNSNKETMKLKPEDYVSKAIENIQSNNSNNNNENPILKDGEIYSSTLEFSRRLDETLKQRKLDLERKNTENTNTTTATTASNGNNNNDKIQNTEKKTTEMEIEEEDEEENDEKDEKDNNNDNLDFGRDIPSYSGGLASVLKLCAQQGYIEDKEEMIGRNLDARIAYEPGSNFVIEHRDQYGNLLSTKEAYRQLSYTFHGYTPKKNHLGKNKMRYKESIAKKGGKVV